MKIVNKKLHLRIMCDCGVVFNKVFGEGQINTRIENDIKTTFVFVKCAKCNLYNEIIVGEEKIN